MDIKLIVTICATLAAIGISLLAIHQIGDRLNWSSVLQLGIGIPLVGMIAYLGIYYSVQSVKSAQWQQVIDLVDDHQVSSVRVRGQLLKGPADFSLTGKDADAIVGLVRDSLPHHLSGPESQREAIVDFFQGRRVAYSAEVVWGRTGQNVVLIFLEEGATGKCVGVYRNPRIQKLLDSYPGK